MDAKGLKKIWEARLLPIPMLGNMVVKVSKNTLPAPVLDTEDDIHHEDYESNNQGSHGNDHCAALELLERRPRHFVHKFVVACLHIFTKLLHFFKLVFFIGRGRENRTPNHGFGDRHYTI